MHISIYGIYMFLKSSLIGILIYRSNSVKKISVSTYISSVFRILQKKYFFILLNIILNNKKNFKKKINEIKKLKIIIFYIC